MNLHLNTIYSTLKNDDSFTHDEMQEWVLLGLVAQDMAKKAYAPYSNLLVGAAAFLSNDEVAMGCNIENASYGLTLCAECGLISDILTEGHVGAKIDKVIAVDVDGNILPPCGRCRQLLFEWSEESSQILLSSGVQAIHSLLPEAFIMKRGTNE